MTAAIISMHIQVISSYGDGPRSLETAVAGLSQADLDLSLSSDSWTIRMIVHHVADGDAIWKSFIAQALGNVGGEFRLQWYWEIPQDEWAKRWNYAQREIETSLAFFRANRRHTTQLLEHKPDALEKTLQIRWPDGKEQGISVRWVVEMQTQHVQGHVRDIQRIREVHGV
jgi:uncharacterized damage-inducible protein DinB